MEDLERKMIAEALNKIDKLVECVVNLQDQINVVKDQLSETIDVAQKADNMLAEQITELHVNLVAITELMVAVARESGQ